RPPITQEEAERLAPAGPACARCGEVPIAGMSVCPSCRNLLRPWVILVGSTVVLLLLLLGVLYRHGAFQSLAPAGRRSSSARSCSCKPRTRSRSTSGGCGNRFRPRSSSQASSLQTTSADS